MSKESTHLENKDDLLVQCVGKDRAILDLGNSPSSLLKKIYDNDCKITCFKSKDKLVSFGSLYEPTYVNLHEIHFSRILRTTKYEIILLNDTLSTIKNAETILKKIRDNVDPNIPLVFSIPNTSFGKIRYKTLNGDFRYFLDKSTNGLHYNFFTLDSILSLLKSTGFGISEIHRINGDLFSDYDGLYGVLPLELIDSIFKDPESVVEEYVFKIIPSNVNEDFDELIKEFPRSIVTENLRNIINSYKDRIFALQKELDEKQDHIKRLHTSLKEFQKEK